jgi:hypothetical protein
MSQPSRILIIGGFSSGKTLFGAQLLSRLQGRESSFHLREASPSLALLEEALVKLSEGMTPGHTSRDLYGTTILPVQDANGNEIDIVWPEFGGEQIDDFVPRRSVSPEWIERIQEADSWVLMLRLMKFRTEEDVATKPLNPQPMVATKSPLTQERLVPEAALDWAAQSKMVELMQMLLYYKEASLYSTISVPRLTVLLSCWDELQRPDGAQPANALKEHLPLFSDFLETNWNPGDITIYGLSALSKPLKNDVADEEFRRLGPEKFGYVVLPSGSTTTDLTVPIAAVMGLDDSDAG